MPVLRSPAFGRGVPTALPRQRLRSEARGAERRPNPCVRRWATDPPMSPVERVTMDRRRCHRPNRRPPRTVSHQVVRCGRSERQPLAVDTLSYDLWRKIWAQGGGRHSSGARRELGARRYCGLRIRCGLFHRLGHSTDTRLPLGSRDLPGRAVAAGLR